MISQRIKYASSTVLLILACVGCASKARLTSFDEFATAGKSYAAATNTLIDMAVETKVSTDSQKLLNTRSGLMAVEPEAFKKRDDAMRALVAEYRKIQAHVALLAEYFFTLAAVANSSAPQAFAAELETTVTKLDALSTELGKGSLLTGASGLAGLTGKIGGLIVQGVQVAQLEKELKRNKDTIDKILVQHERLLEAIRGQILQDQDLLKSRQYETNVLAAYQDSSKLSSASDQKEWKQARVAYLTQPFVVEELERAAAALRGLRHAWIALLSDDLGPAKIQEVAGVFDSILTDVQTIKNTN